MQDKKEQPIKKYKLHVLLAVLLNVMRRGMRVCLHPLPPRHVYTQPRAHSNRVLMVWPGKCLAGWSQLAMTWNF